MKYATLTNLVQGKELPASQLTSFDKRLINILSRLDETFNLQDRAWKLVNSPARVWTNTQLVMFFKLFSEVDGLNYMLLENKQMTNDDYNLFVTIHKQLEAEMLFRMGSRNAS